MATAAPGSESREGLLKALVAIAPLVAFEGRADNQAGGEVVAVQATHNAVEVSKLAVTLLV